MKSKYIFTFVCTLVILGSTYIVWIMEAKAPSSDTNEPASQDTIQHAEIETINGISVPPEPDPELNNATLAGVDVNENGVRDDVERWIVKTYPDSAKIRSSLNQRAAALQRIVTTSDHIANKQLLDSARDCMSATFSVDASDADGARKALNVGTELHAKVVNTKDRIQAYVSYNETRGGTVTTLTRYEDTSFKCIVDPRTLPN